MAIVAACAVPHPPLIIPAVGRGRERDIQATIDAYEEVARRIAALAPDTLVISSPHSTCYLDYLHVSPGTAASGSFAAYGAPQAAYEAHYDQRFVMALEAACQAEQLPAGTRGEREAQLDHATMIPLHFILPACAQAGVHPQVVRMGLAGFDAAEHYRLGTLVQRVASVLGKRVVYVASGDLSHKLLAEGPYGFAPQGPKFDERMCTDFATADFLDLLQVDESFARAAAECGLRSFQIMAGAFDATQVRGELLSHEGPFGVGYGVAWFEPVGAERGCDERALLDVLEEQEVRRAEAAARAASGARAETASCEDELVSLARLSLETYVRSGGLARVSPPELPDGRTLSPELLGQRAACFVSLKKKGQLRGCIGTILPTKDSLAAEICANAVSAGCHDPRFAPVEPDELDQLVYSVDVLTELEPISGLAELDVRRYGVIVHTRDGRRGLLLPDLEGVDSVEQQVQIAAQKGGIDLVGEAVELQRFEVVRHR